MTVKLTLSIDDQVVKKAKHLSRKRGKSLSKMVEEYLSAISIQEEQKTSAVDRILELTNGKINMPESADYKEFIGRNRYEDEMERQKKQH